MKSNYKYINISQQSINIAYKNISIKSALKDKKHGKVFQNFLDNEQKSYYLQENLNQIFIHIENKIMCISKKLTKKIKIKKFKMNHQKINFKMLNSVE